MKHFRPLVLVSLTLAVLVSACSQVPEGMGGLEAQFGTSQNDFANVVTTDVQRGFVYVSGAYGDSVNFTDGGTSAFLRSYNRDGTFRWERRSGTFANVLPQAADTDDSGNVYLAYNSTTSSGDGNSAVTGFISKLSKEGALRYRLVLDRGIAGLTSDASGNVYVALTASVRKYNGSGKLVWEQQLTDSEISGLTGLELAPDGSLYVIGAGTGDDGSLIRLRSSDGALLRSSYITPTPLDVAVSGSFVYVLSELDAPSSFVPVVSKFRADGSRLWSHRGAYGDEDDEDAEAIGRQSLSVDGQGNTYIAGTFYEKVEADDPGFSYGYNADYFVRKYTPSGAVAFSKINRLSNTDEAGKGIFASSADELYLVGSTDAKVNGKNFGKRDAFLLRLNAQATRVWSR